MGKGSGRPHFLEENAPPNRAFPAVELAKPSPTTLSRHARFDFADSDAILVRRERGPFGLRLRYRSGLGRGYSISVAPESRPSRRQQRSVGIPA